MQWPRSEAAYIRKSKFPVRLLGFTMPALILVTAFILIPFLMTVKYSFMRWNGISKAATYLGPDNYIKFFTDDKAIGALVFTLLFAVSFVIIVNVLAISIAVLLDGRIPGKGFFRAALYIPNVISLVVIGFIWKFIFGKVFDSIYASVASESLTFLTWSWLGAPSLAKVSVVLVTIWQSLGFYVIVYVAALQSVPGDLIEAATIDGAGWFRRFFSVTIPMIMPSITFSIFYAISNSFKTFDMIFTLTDGGPGWATTTMALDIYKTAFNSNQFGYGSAKSVILFVIVATITTFQISLFRRKEVEV